MPSDTDSYDLERTISPTFTESSDTGATKHPTGAHSCPEEEIEIYKDTWAVIHSWKQELAGEIISRFTNGRKRRTTPSAGRDGPAVHLPAPQQMLTVSNAGEPETSQFEACTPTARNIAYFAPKEGYARFIAHADQPDFPAEHYINSRFQKLEWDLDEQEQWDPDRAFVYKSS